ncbi:MAG: hypothetical protein CL565_06805 [Alphaproteobacteria bacterium]|nr:hypothetical protein [Alphaproteobacteria bacterium]|tara:strand:- start:52 stop:249 length:198 start_codon:yes stop_codon:yes gene_type:complete
MKELTRVYSVFEADILCSKLRIAGIESFAQGREITSQIAGLEGGIRILVAEENRDKALEIIKTDV